MSVFEISDEIETGLAERVAKFLRDNPSPVKVMVNSAGGTATEGAAVMAEFQRHGQVTCCVQGIAASAASLLVMGAAKIVMHPSALMMIHDPSGMTWGTAANHRTSADALEKMTATYAQAYAKATGHPVNRIAAWMADETWLTAEEALDLNFCDEIEGAESETPMFASFDYSRFQHPPQSLAALAKKDG